MIQLNANKFLINHVNPNLIYERIVGGESFGKHSIAIETKQDKFSTRLKAKCK